jgi:hypothetical protein
MNTATLLWGLVFGSIGLGYFMYGKRRSNFIVRCTGIGLMIFPYFVSNTLALVAIGGLLMFVPYFFSK